jgi:hypothetical protein
MRTAALVGITILIVTVIGIAWARANSRQSNPAASSNSAMSKQGGFYCDRLVLTADQRKHKAELEKVLRSLITGVHELSDGYQFEFPPETHTLQMLSEWIGMERTCCPFFEFDLSLQAEAGPLSMSLRGREGVKQFIRADFGPDWFGK